ncbi:MAG: hypothetical protein J6Y67_01435, partial [Lachnospiraceae bacterium]|nr:hypothetical protein [Lachnospiraceae bacterium]
ATADWIFYDDREDYDTIYRVYDIEGLNLLGQINSRELPTYSYYGEINLTKKGYALIDVGIANNDAALLIWDPAAREPEPIEDARKIEPTQEILEMRQYAERIREEFGVRVYFEEVDLHGQMFSNYELQFCYDMDRLRATMDALYEAAAEFPDGFWTEILADGKKGCVRFFLCGGFVRTGLSSIEDAAALTSAGLEDVCMAYGSTYISQFSETFVHETMHMMEVRIRAYCEDNQLDFESYWNNVLNTKEYGYFDAYTDSSGKDLVDERGTYRDNPKKAWYIDAYSRTNEREDRARILEYLYSGVNFYFKDSEHLRTKAENLCAIIRAAFPSVRNSSVPMRWETYIGVVDPEDYLQNYRLATEEQSQQE